MGGDERRWGLMLFVTIATCKDMQPLLGVPPESMRDHYDVSVLALVRRSAIQVTNPDAC